MATELDNQPVEKFTQRIRQGKRLIVELPTIGETLASPELGIVATLQFVTEELEVDGEGNPAGLVKTVSDGSYALNQAELAALPGFSTLYPAARDAFHAGRNAQ